MIIKCGNDLVADERIKKNLDNKNFLEKIFHPSELVNKDVKKLSGIFALKESVFKALEISSDNWLEIEIKNKNNGKATIVLSESIKPKNIISIDCSVSHENDLSSGVVIILLDKE